MLIFSYTILGIYYEICQHSNVSEWRNEFLIDIKIKDSIGKFVKKYFVG